MDMISEIKTVFDHNGDPLDVLFYFLEKGDRAFHVLDFEPGSDTRKHLEIIEEIILYGKLQEAE